MNISRNCSDNGKCYSCGVEVNIKNGRMDLWPVGIVNTHTHTHTQSGQGTKKGNCDSTEHHNLSVVKK